uniref:Uncharacterized protein n=1 Tax=Anguilla anguilla TaxID=7936 RepID=A0A0E9QL47_ANGAN
MIPQTKNLPSSKCLKHLILQVPWEASNKKICIFSQVLSFPFFELASLLYLQL